MNGLSPFLCSLLLFFETSYVYAAAVSADEMRVPYVPYVVVDKNKDEFDYDRLGDEIFGYLGRRRSAAAAGAASTPATTTLYDFLKSGLSPVATPPAPVAGDVRRTSVQPSSSAYYTLGYPARSPDSVGSAYAASSVYAASPAYPSGSAFPAYPASVYESARKENRLVTAVVEATTYQPHKYSTPLDTSPRGYPRNDFAAAADGGRPARPFPAPQLPFVPVKNGGFAPLVDGAAGALRITTAVDTAPAARFPSAGDMKCSLRSSRHVYDGDCVSRIPVVETVCADRCIRYEYKKSRKPYFSEDSKTNSLITGETKKQVVALSCRDGDVKKQKVKLYCRDGTVINDVIRIVLNCVCDEHSEKVRATKRNKKSPRRIEAKMAYGSPHPAIRSRPNY